MQTKPDIKDGADEGRDLALPDNLTLEEALQMLERTTDRLQDRELPLEEALAAYRQGLSLVSYCTQRIDLAEKQVLALNEEGGFSEF